MEKVPTSLLVVAAAIRDGEGRLLLQQCQPHKRHAGLWEFPGGKVEEGEIPRSALCREILEELGISLEPGAMEPVGFAEEMPESGRPGIVLILYSCPSWSGQPASVEGQEWGWFTLPEARKLPLPPMDGRLLEKMSRDWPD